ncbi:MAG: hypothetical protein AMQ22_01474 [Candidatus Methanofastidiosum methylothiophilum]|uniref:Uncharacterized protein n=1 Tax=Candidatus Methanofastidiosum methylothiophilum TaxID=1705564 RepID=A0A150IZA2_9EURY|nr:MAG: hypothetical protein AMQ22_01474 [Candidatus Methanofastidiosum methylthiophilus]
MKDFIKYFKGTSTTIILSIIANLLTKPIESVLQSNNIKIDLNLLNYWYIFIIIILLILLIEILRIVMDENKSRLWRSKLYRILLFLLDDIGIEKKYIANNINARLNLARKEIDHTKEILPRLVRIEWVENEKDNKHTYDLNEGEYVVKVHKYKSQEENIIDISYAMSRRTTLSGVRYLLSENRNLECSIDNIVVEKLLNNIRIKHVLDLYYEKYLKPNLEDDDLYYYYHELKDLDGEGLFTRIYLTEINELSKRLIGRPYSPHHLEEIEGIAKYLHDINPDLTKDKVDLDYKKAFCRFGIILIKSEKIVQTGIDNYIKAVNYYIQNNYYAFYILFHERKWSYEWSKVNNLINNLIDEIKSYPQIDSIEDDIYEGYDFNGYTHNYRCIRYNIFFKSN